MTLPEMLISLVLFAVVMLSILGLFDATARQQPKDQERADALGEAQAGLHRMTRELRQGYRVLDADSKSMYVRVMVNGVDMHVKYDCGVPDPVNSAYLRCVRWAAPIGQVLPSTPGDVVVDRSLSEVLFTYTPGPLNPNYVSVRIVVPQKGEAKSGYASNFVFEDGFYLRNIDAIR